MNKLHCEECVKTNNHCCLADIPFDYMEALYLANKGKEFGLDLMLVEHPSFNDKVVILDSKTEFGSSLQGVPCVFLRDGKCLVYEDRPFICKQYGSEFIRCRYEALNIKGEDIKSFTFRDIQVMDREVSDMGLISKAHKEIPMFRNGAKQ